MIKSTKSSKSSKVLKREKVKYSKDIFGTAFNPDNIRKLEKFTTPNYN